MSDLPKFRIATSDCIRCAACASIAPELFLVEDDGAKLLRQPETREEVDDVLAAAAACPVEAILPA